MISHTAILAAIFWLAPQLPQTTCLKYAHIIRREAARRAVDPFIIVAIVHVESSWNPRAQSPTQDWGLGQIHVSTTTNPRLRGREQLLFDPATNIYYAAKMMAMWRSWHERACRRKHKHPWWSHYQYGYRVRNLMWTNKVRDLYHELARRFRPRPQHLLDT